MTPSFWFLLAVAPFWNNKEDRALNWKAATHSDWGATAA